MNPATTELELRFGSTGPCDVLVFGAHPDDAELLCGGTIAKLSQNGKNVSVVDLTEAELSTNGSVEQRRQETHRASEILKLHSRYQIGLQDGEVENTPQLAERLAIAIRKLSPQLVIGPPTVCRHPDHEALGRSLSHAIFFSGLKKKMPEVKSVTRPQCWRYVEVSDTPCDVVIDITEQWQQRVDAVMAYRSQFDANTGETTFINDGFLERLERRYRAIGERVGVSFAEPFTTDAPPMLHLPTDLL
jgi:bacillithiol biosynthesis deacetylase BshB1